MATLVATARLLTLALCALALLSCSDDNRQTGDSTPSTDDTRAELLGEQKRRNTMPTCVETSLPLERCFANLDDYAKWKICVRQGGDWIECYVGIYQSAIKPRPVGSAGGADEPDEPDLPEVDNALTAPVYPEGRHFQFDYIIRPLTDEQVTYLQDWGDITTLVDRQSCRFVSVDPTLSRRDFRVRSNHTGFDLLFDVIGDSPGCADKKVVHFFVTFLILHPGLALYPTHDDTDPSKPPLVLADSTNYILADDLYTYFTWHSYTPATVATASFEFVAESLNEPGEFMVGYFGHMELMRNE